MHPDAPNNWHLFSTMTDALFSTVVSLSNGGFDVIADTVFEREACFAAMQAAFADRTYRLVAVTAPLHVLEAREQARGNRRIGQARDQQARVLQDASYDLRLDTYALTLDECVDRVVALLDVGPPARLLVEPIDDTAVFEQQIQPRVVLRPRDPRRVVAPASRAVVGARAHRSARARARLRRDETPGRLARGAGDPRRGALDLVVEGSCVGSEAGAKQIVVNLARPRPWLARYPVVRPSDAANRK